MHSYSGGENCDSDSHLNTNENENKHLADMRAKGLCVYYRKKNQRQFNVGPTSETLGQH